MSVTHMWNTISYSMSPVDHPYQISANLSIARNSTMVNISIFYFLFHQAPRVMKRISLWSKKIETMAKTCSSVSLFFSDNTFILGLKRVSCIWRIEEEFAPFLMYNHMQRLNVCEACQNGYSTIIIIFSWIKMFAKFHRTVSTKMSHNSQFLIFVVRHVNFSQNNQCLILPLVSK